MIISDALDQSKNVKHGFFTRQGGVSKGVLGSLNCGYGSGDDPGTVRENRNRAMSNFGLTAADLNTVYQVHSPDVAITETPWDVNDRPKADAIVTTRPDLVIGVMTADCTPVLFADADNGVIGAAHAGWRGAFGGVLENCVQVMEQQGASRNSITAVIGPCIRQPSYEVGPEFFDAFIAGQETNASYFKPSSKENHHLFDLSGYVSARLSSCDIGRIDDVAIDTYTDETRFYSYRRATHLNEADYGRGLSAIVLNG